MILFASWARNDEALPVAGDSAIAERKDSPAADRAADDVGDGGPGALDRGDAYGEEADPTRAARDDA